jgi:uncharacterized protein (DUF736 family)
MSYEQKDNSGALFQNKEKRSENSPDYSGSIRIEGHDWWISGWRKMSKDGTPYLSVSIKPKNGTAERPEQKAAEFKESVRRNFPDAQMDDEVPF